MFSPTFKAAALSAAVFFPALAGAASVDINPVRIDLLGQGRPTELRLTNTGDTDLSIQVDTLRWGQDLNGTDQLVETNELLAVPPLFTVPPGGQQIVRIGYLGDPDAELEQSFRLLLTELLPPRSPASGSSGLSMRMRFSIPAFVAPALAAASPELVLQDVASGEDATQIKFANAGTGHVQVGRIEIRGSDGWESLPETSTIRYMLPGAEATVEIPTELAPISAVRISSIDGRDWEYAVRVPN